MSTAYPWPSRRAAEQMPRVSETLTDEQLAAGDLTPEDLDRVARDVYDATRLDWGYICIALAGLIGGLSLIWSLVP